MKNLQGRFLDNSLCHAKPQSTANCLHVLNKSQSILHQYSMIEFLCGEIIRKSIGKTTVLLQPNSGNFCEHFYVFVGGGYSEKRYLSSL